MTTHVNDQILAAVISALNGLATTGDRIDEWSLRVKEVADPRLVVAVACPGVETGAQGVQQREIEVMVSGYAKAAVPSSVLGSIQAEVESALDAAGTLGGLLPGKLRFVSDERGIDYSLEKPVGKVEMRFSGLCFTAAGSPGAVV